MPRLLVITGELPVASETFVIGHIQGMRGRGWDVAVAANHVDHGILETAFGSDVPETFELEPRAKSVREKSRFTRWLTERKVLGPGKDHLFHAKAGKRSRSRAVALVEVMRRWKPDVIHAHFGPVGAMAAPAAQLLGVPLVVNFRGYDFLNYPAESGWDVYETFPQGTLAVGHTAFCENILRAHLKVQVEHVRRGVNRDRFVVPNRSEKWGRQVRLLVVGRVMFCKGQHLCLEALSLLRRLDPDRQFELTIAGGGAAESNLSVIAKELGVYDSVEITGSLSHDEVAEQMRRADIQLIPSLPRSDGWVENFCTVASEGMASGLPVVAANIGGIPETVHGAGVLVPPASARCLAKGVIHVLKQAGPAEWATKAAAKAASFSDTAMLDDYDRVTRKAMEGVGHAG